MKESDTRVRLEQLKREQTSRLDHETGIKAQSEVSFAGAQRVRTQAEKEK